MSKRSEKALTSTPASWLVPAAVAGVIVTAVISYARSGETYAAPGSPYYGKAVQEAINGLKNPGDNAVPAGRPPLAAGLSPDDYYWCDNCHTYHKREPGQTPPAGATPSPAAGVGTVAAQPPDAIPPLSEGLSANDYYWCVNCKVYHARQPAETHPAWAGVPYKLPGQPGPALEH